MISGVELDTAKVFIVDSFRDFHRADVDLGGCNDDVFLVDSPHRDAVDLKRPSDE